MSWQDQQNGKFGGSSPHPNDTQGLQDYWRAQGEKNAADQRARDAAVSSAYAAPSITPSYSSPNSSPPSYTSPSYVSPSSESSSGNGSSYISSGGSYSGSIAPVLASNSLPNRLGIAGSRRAIPTIPIIAGLVLGALLAVLPFAAMRLLNNSLYLDKLIISMAVFTSATVWSMVELWRRNLRAAVGTAFLGYWLAEILWFQTRLTFLEIYLQIANNALKQTLR